MTRRRTESSLLKPLATYARNRGFNCQRSEVPFYEYRIDFFGFSPREDLTFAVELKLTKWRRALEQSLIYQLCADLVYIALPEATALRVEIGLLGEHGIGLLSVSDSGRCKEVLRAARSDVVRCHYREEYIDILKGTKKWPR